MTRPIDMQEKKRHRKRLVRERLHPSIAAVKKEPLRRLPAVWNIDFGACGFHLTHLFAWLGAGGGTGKMKLLR